MMNSKVSLKNLHQSSSENPARMSQPGTDRSFDRSLLYLRDLAVCLVILTHVAAQWLDSSLQSGTPALYSAHLCSILSFVGVTLFVMLSGVLYLAPSHRQKSTSPRFIVQKALRFFLIYLFWKLFYFAEDLLLNLPDSAERSASFVKEKFLLSMFRTNGKYHLWYLPMFCLLLLLVPLIYEGAQHLKACALYLCIFFAAAILLPTAFLFEFPFKYLLMDFRNVFDLGHYLGYAGYFLLGHVLYELSQKKTLLKNPFWKNKKHFLVPLWILALTATVIAVKTEAARSASQGVTDSSFATPFVLNTFLLAAALLFTFCCRSDKAFSSEISGKAFIYQSVCTRFLISLSKASLGIYLIHPFVLDLIQKAGFLRDSVNPIIGIPILWIALLSISWLISAMLRRIPVIQRLVSV